MYIKLQNNIINLDLIKKVSEVKAYHVLRLDYEEGNLHYYHEIGSAQEEASLLHKTTNGNEYQREYMVVYGFEIHYLNEKWPQKVSVGTNRRDAKKFLDSFTTLLNNNQPVIHEVKI
jgi:hypothetical protein